MFKRIIQFSSFFVIFSMVFALPLDVLAQEVIPIDIGSIKIDDSAGTAVEKPVVEVKPAVEVIKPLPPVAPRLFGDGEGVNSGRSSGDGDTCNVDGKELPGSCKDRKAMYGSEEGSGGNGNGEGVRMGPSEEEQQKMDAKREEMEKKQRQKNMVQMQRGVKSMAKPLATIEAKIAKLEKQGIAVSAGIKEKITAAKAAVAAILAATDPEEVQEQMESMQEISQEMGDTMRQLENLSRLPQALKNAEKEIKRLDKAYISSVTKFKRAKIDAAVILEKWFAAINELKTALADIKQNGIGEDEDPMQVVGEVIFERLEDTWRFQQTIEMVLNAKRNLKQVASALKKYERVIATLKKKGNDVAEAESLLAEMKTKYEEVNKLLVGGMDPDEVDAVLGDLESYMDLQQQIEEALDLDGPSMFEKEMKAQQPSGDRMPKINIPKQLMQDTLNWKEQFANDWAQKEAKLLVDAQTEKTAKLKALAAVLKDAKAKIVELTAAGVVLPDSLKDGVLATLSSLALPSAVAQR